MKQMILVMVFCLAFSGSGLGAEEPTKPDNFFISDDDYPWAFLRGATQNKNQPPSIEQISKVYKKLNARNNPKTIWGALQAVTLARDVACLKSTGSERLCRCLGKELPAYTTYSSYVAIVTGEKNLNYSGLTPIEIKKLIERIIDVREKCVVGQN